MGLAAARPSRTSVIIVRDTKPLRRAKEVFMASEMVA